MYSNIILICILILEMAVLKIEREIEKSKLDF